jgi:hypothetical protein
VKHYNTRTDLLELLPKEIKFCEIGVFRGEFAKQILKIVNPKELWLVEIWEGTWGSGDKDGNNHTEIINMENIYLSLYQQTKEKNNIHVVRSKSELFLLNCEDNYFDAIYIDGDHTAEAVYKDLANSFKKIKDKGVLMGHDYHYKIGGEVVYAVNKFCTDFNQTINYIADDGCPSFAIEISK